MQNPRASRSWAERRQVPVPMDTGMQCLELAAIGTASHLPKSKAVSTATAGHSCSRRKSESKPITQFLALQSDCGLFGFQVACRFVFN